MTDTKQGAHTAGPWKVYHALLRPQFPGARIIEVQDADGNAIIRWAGFDNSERLKKTHLANARLIAAAPELLAVLKEIVHPDNAPLVMSDAWSLRLIERARAALSRAQGTSHAYPVDAQGR